MKRFWVVMGTNGLSHSPCRHSSAMSAFNEAERLSRTNGGTFIVLEAIGQAERVDTRITHFEEEPPF